MNRMKIEELFSFLLCDFVYIFFTSLVTGRARSHTDAICELPFVCLLRSNGKS